MACKRLKIFVHLLAHSRHIKMAGAMIWMGAMFSPLMATISRSAQGWPPMGEGRQHSVFTGRKAVFNEQSSSTIYKPCATLFMIWTLSLTRKKETMIITLVRRCFDDQMEIQAQHVCSKHYIFLSYLPTHLSASNISTHVFLLFRFSKKFCVCVCLWISYYCRVLGLKKTVNTSI